MAANYKEIVERLASWSKRSNLQIINSKHYSELQEEFREIETAAIGAVESGLQQHTTAAAQH